MCLLRSRRPRVESPAPSPVTKMVLKTSIQQVRHDELWLCISVAGHSGNTCLGWTHAIQAASGSVVEPPATDWPREGHYPPRQVPSQPVSGLGHFQEQADL